MKRPVFLATSRLCKKKKKTVLDRRQTGAVSTACCWWRWSTTSTRWLTPSRRTRATPPSSTSSTVRSNRHNRVRPCAAHVVRVRSARCGLFSVAGRRADLGPDLLEKFKQFSTGTGILPENIAILPNNGNTTGLMEYYYRNYSKTGDAERLLYLRYVTFLFSSRGMSGSLSLLLSWIGNLNLHLKRSLLNYFLISHFKVGSLYSVRCVDEYKINTKFLLWIALTWHLCVYWGVLLFSLKEAAQVQVEECKIIMQHVVACCLLVKVD